MRADGYTVIGLKQYANIGAWQGPSWWPKLFTVPPETEAALKSEVAETLALKAEVDKKAALLVGVTISAGSLTSSNNMLPSLTANVSDRMLL